MYGKCPVCSLNVKLIYQDPARKAQLVIGPHHPPAKSCKLDDFRNNNCSGVRQRPESLVATELEKTAQK